MDTLIVALALILAGGLLALITARLFSLMKTCAVGLIVFGCVTGFAGALLQLVQGGTPRTIAFDWLGVFPLVFTLDTVAAYFLLPVFCLSALAAMYSFQYLHDRQRSVAVALHYFFYALLLASMAMVTLAGNMVAFALAWEIMSVSSFFLVMYDGHKEETRHAGYLYFVFTQAGALVLFAAFGILYAQTGSFSFEGLAVLPEQVKLAACLLLLIGFGSKAGVMPLHIWLPYAHPAAPSHVSAVMSGVMIKMGVYGIFRFYLLLAPSSSLVPHTVLVLGMISGLLGVVYAIGKHDLKRLLAYSSVENIGIILLGLGIGMLGVSTGHATMAACGFAGGLLHLWNHSLFKSLLFMGAGSVLHQTGTLDSNQLGGLMKTMPRTGRACLAGSVAISGLPPFNGFIGEFLIYYGAIHGLALSRTPMIFSLLAIVSLSVIGGFAAACFTKVIGIIFLGEPRTEKAAKAREAGGIMVAVPLLLAVVCFVIGLWPDHFVRAALAAASAVPSVAAFDPAPVARLMGNITRTVALFLALVALVELLRRRCYAGKEVTSSGTWGCGFTQPTVRMQYTGASFADSIIECFRPFVQVRKTYLVMTSIFPARAHYSAREEDVAELGLNALLVRPILTLLGILRWIQHGNIQLYIAYIVLAIVAMLLFF